MCSETTEKRNTAGAGADTYFTECAKKHHPGARTRILVRKLAQGALARPHCFITKCTGEYGRTRVRPFSKTFGGRDPGATTRAALPFWQGKGTEAKVGQSDRGLLFIASWSLSRFRDGKLCELEQGQKRTKFQRLISV